MTRHDRCMLALEVLRLLRVLWPELESNHERQAVEACIAHLRPLTRAWCQHLGYPVD